MDGRNGYHGGGFAWGVTVLKCRIILEERVWLSFGSEDFDDLLACAFSLRLQGCGAYALVKKAYLVVS